MTAVDPEIDALTSLHRHPILRKIEDFADSPLVPALLEKVHLETDPVMLTVRTRPVSRVLVTIVADGRC